MDEIGYSKHNAAFHVHVRNIKVCQLTAQTQVLNGSAVPFEIFVDSIPLEI